MVVAIAKESILKTRMKGITTSNPISDPALDRYFTFHMKRKVELGAHMENVQGMVDACGTSVGR